jgi:hypothetical protein
MKRVKDDATFENTAFRIGRVYMVGPQLDTSWR